MYYVNMKIKKGNHCAYQIHYHIVFPVKYRKALIRKEVKEALLDISHEIAIRYEIEIESLGCDKEHVHLLCGAHPKYSPGQLVRVFKSNTARELFHRFSELKKELWGGEFWSDGYYVATVGERGDWGVVERYVREQGKEPTEIQLTLF